MAKAIEVMGFLRPNGGYTQSGYEYEGITFVNCEPFTKEEYEAAFDLVDAAKLQAESDAIAARSAAEAKLAALGLTADDLKALGL
jgi:folate-dependent tRNA-U54 methylase TrmFO/GidA